MSQLNIASFIFYVRANFPLVVDENALDLYCSLVCHIKRLYSIDLNMHVLKRRISCSNVENSSLLKMGKTILGKRELSNTIE